MGDKIELINSIGKIIVFLMWILSAFLFTVKSSKKISNRLFASFLIVTSFDLTGLFFPYDFSETPNLVIFKSASSLLQMPLIYLYFLSACYSDFKLRLKHLIHAALFLIFLIAFKLTSISDQIYSLFKIIIEIQWFVYIIAIFLLLKRYKTIFKENYSNPIHLNYKWLFQIAIVFCISHFFVILKWIMSEYNYDRINDINLVISISALTIITFFVLKALLNPQLFSGVQSFQEPLKKPNKGIIKDDVDEKEIDRIKSFMESERPYLDFELTLSKLAHQFNTTEKDLSILINHQIGKHFFDFINDYRVKEAKSILEDSQKKKVTILEIVYESGFNSKSSFYSAFKKVTGKTPTEYRKEALSD
ncbi:helix-turn-helix domain-containing protein [Marinigracilibium pacificum]|uniref:AraC family transcriptional regulator n=1 Tax=Marinigracilibium pacificum TaxID=2729599 RepID=A0A848J3Q8_9BACT|nr:AraC family transcriptional regulator [Marinigracilibium pacificum]